MKTFSLMASILLGLALAAPGTAQPAEPPAPVEIVNSAPESVFVRPGGGVDKVRLYGRGFELVKSAIVRHAGSPSTLVMAKLHSVSRGVAELEVKAAATAVPGDDYELQLVTARGSVPVRLPIEVAPSR